jgi:sirohydrochlorin cobaltochelatase
MRGLILFAHGARDPRWAEPLERLRDRVVDAAPDTPVDLAFLEIMEPDLPTAAARLIATGCTGITIAPVFLGQGGHVRRDLAALVATLAERNPGIDVRCAEAAGEDDSVLDALARYCLGTLEGRTAGSQNSHAGRR